MRWEGEVLAEASRMWSSGDTITKIAERFGVTRNSVSGITERRRDMFPHRDRTPKEKVEKILVERFTWTPDRVEVAAGMWKNGVITDDIAAHFGISRNSVGSLCRRHRELFPKRIGERNGHGNAATVKKKPFIPWDRAATPQSKDYRDPPLKAYDMALLPGVPMAENKGCMYPLTGGDAEVHLFCGCYKVPLKPYCAEHVERTKGRAVVW